MAGRFSVEAVFKAVDRVTAPVSKMQNRVNKFTRGMNRGFNKLNRNVNKLGRGIKKTGIAIVGALALSGAAMADVITTGAEFEQTLVSAAAKFPGEIRKGTESFKLLEDAARKAGSTTEFTASEAAGAINFLAMAGLDAKASVAALPGVIDLATAAGVDLATATDVATDSLGAFGLMSKDAVKLGMNLARVNDVIAKTTTTANTTVETLFETIKDGGPVATAAGASIETFAALAGELANAGIKGTRAGTTLKNMFLKLSAPGAKGAKILKRLGVATKDSKGDMLDIVDILGSLNKSLEGLGTADKAGVLEGIFGKIPIAGVNVLLQSGSKRLNEYRKQLVGASGASSEMASVMRDTLQGRLNSLKSAIEGVKISIFSMNEGPLNDVVERMTNWVRANEELIASNIGGFFLNIADNFESISLWLGRIGKGLAIFIAFSVILKTFIAIMTAVNLVMAMNPLVLMALGVAALIAGFIALVVWVDDVIAVFDKLPGVIQLILAPFGLLIAAIKGLKLIGAGLGNALGFLVIETPKAIDKMIAGFKSLKPILDALLNPIGAITKGFQAIGGFSGIANALGFGDNNASNNASNNDKNDALQPHVVSPQDRVARSIEENKTSAEVTIKAGPGTNAELTGGKLGGNLQLEQSGAFN